MSAKIPQKIPQSAVLLGIVSFFNDAASDAIYPLLPIFLTQSVGATPSFVGLYEGLAETFASLLKYYSGIYSDRLKKYRLIVLFGYVLSNFVRPFTGIITTPFQALFIRVIDRIGKGLRSPPRDAWLSRTSPSEIHGKVFGFHRAFDNAGAVVGPLLAILFLKFYGNDYRTLFILTAIPGLVCVIFVIAALLVKEEDIESFNGNNSRKLVHFADLKLFSPEFKRYLICLFIFMIANSSDAFLILKLKSVGLSEIEIITTWLCLHVFKSAFSYYFGKLSDRIGAKKSIEFGWVFFITTYLMFAFLDDTWSLFCALFLYALFSGQTEGPEKSLIAKLAPVDQRGTAFGLFHMTTGLAALPSSLLMGLLWQYTSPAVAFCSAAIIAWVALFLFRKIMI